MKTRAVFLATVAMLLCTLQVRLATARTWYILSDGTGDAPTIQAGIDSAAVADTVLIADGTYTGDGNRDIDFLGKAITVRSQSGDPEVCIIDCQGSETDSHRGFHFHADEGSSSLLRGVTVIGGYLAGYSSGGGILCTVPSAPTIINCRLVANYAANGGGIAVIGQNDDGPTLIGCEITGNSVAYPSDGGGIYCDVAGGSYEDCVIADNEGVGIYFVDVFAWPTVTGCTIRGNTGHGIAINEGTPAIDNCLILDNALDGIECQDSSSQISRCTIVGNRNGLAIWRSSLELDHTIIAFNTAAGVTCAADGAAALSCCDVYGNAGGDWTGCIEDQLGLTGNIHLDPMFCGEQNPDEPLSLSSSSPCAPDANPDCGLIGALPVGCTATGIDDQGQAPIALRLHRCYPNPFNPQTTITFALDRSQRAEVAVYDLTGKQIAVLADRVFDAGNHSVIWNGKDVTGRAVTSGTYVVRLSTESTAQTRKVLLLR